MIINIQHHFFSIPHQLSNLFNADLWNTITEIGTVVMPKDVSSCSFIRESYWKRFPKEKQDEINDFIKKRSEWYYKKENL